MMKKILLPTAITVITIWPYMSLATSLFAYCINNSCNESIQLYNITFYADDCICIDPHESARVLTTGQKLDSLILGKRGNLVCYDLGYQVEDGSILYISSKDEDYAFNIYDNDETEAEHGGFTPYSSDDDTDGMSAFSDCFE